MTSKKSSGNPVTSMLGFTFRKNLAFTLIAAIISLLIGPARLFKSISDTIYRRGEFSDYNLSADFSFSYADFSFSEEFPAMAMIFALISGAFLVFLIIYNFSFLYKKSASDAFHSFPLNRTSLLICRYVPALVLSLVPLTVGYVGEILVTVGFGIELDLLLIVKTYIFSVIMLLLCGGATLIFTVCCGTVFDMIVAMLGIIGGFPLIIVIIHALSNTYIHGYSADSIYSVLSFTSPFAYAAYSLYSIISWDVVNPAALRWYSQLISILLGIGFTALAAYLYNRRRSEKAGEPYAFKFLPVIIAFIAAFVCGALLGLLFSDVEIFSPVFWIFAVLGALLGAVIYGAVARRGFKTVLHSLKIGSTAVLAIILTVVIIVTGGLGYETRIPKDSDIVSANVHFSGTELEYTGQEISLVTNLHRALTKGDETEQYNMRFVYITYVLKNGSTMSRDYYVTLESGAEELLKIYKSDTHKKSIQAIGDNKSYYYHEFSYYSESGHKEKVADSGDINTFLALYVQELDALTVDDLNNYNRNEGYEEVYISANSEDGGYIYHSLPLYPGMDKSAAFAQGLEDKEIDEAK